MLQRRFLTLWNDLKRFHREVMLHMSDRTIRILLLAVIIFFLIILCVVVIDYIRKSKRNRMYVQLFEETYKNNSVIDTLLKIIEVYKIRSVPTTHT